MKVAVIGQGWTTIIGPPTVLSQVLQQCTVLRALPKQELKVRTLLHILSVSNAELDELLGSSSLLELPAGNVSWKFVVKMACEQILARPFNIPEAVKDLDSHLESVKNVDMNVIGISSHEKFVADQLKATGKQVTIRHEHSIAISLPRYLSESSGKIAIVGMGGRGPGADDLTDFWRIISKGDDVHKRIPDDRFDINEFFSATHTGKCTTSAQFGCFIDRPGAFDARFFNVSHREALLIEPCHRLWLMSVYEALEMAGYSRNRTQITDPNHIGVFFGQSVEEWRAATHHLGCDSYVLQGMQRAFAPGRVNHHFKWEGPTYSVDSACASSASAITLACQNLLLRECDMAVAGGANVMSSPHTFSALSRSGILSMTGGCKTYRDDADGYCRGEFAGAVILKRIEDAVAANDNILAVIAASGRNHSGNALSITTSDDGAQYRLFRQVLNKAQVAPREVAYVEMHGTGTQVGDTAEMTAVVNAFKRDGSDKNPLRVGAVKANIGHCEAAAGIASLLKCVLCLQEELLPQVANMPHKLNSRFPNLMAANVEIPAQNNEFKAVKDKKRRIIINNFDASGGNTCLLVEDFARAAPPESTDPRSCHVITLSAKSATSHKENKNKLLSFLRAGADDHRIQDLAYTTNARRIHYPIRTAITASSTQEFINKLDADVGSYAMAERVITPPIVIMFTGQGSHYAGMAADLYKTSNAFREMIDLCVIVCHQQGFPEFLDIITNPSIDIATKSTTQTQLAVVSLEIALASFWKANGVEPDLVMGHSLGEYAALYVAGILSLTDVLYLVGRRAQLILERCDPHAYSMLSVVSSLDRVKNYLQRRPLCEIACINSPKAIVVSGAVGEIKLLMEELEKDGIRFQKLSVPYGFHSNQVDPVLDEYATLARTVVYSAPRIPIASTLTGTIIEKPDMINEMYLVRQIRERVDYVGGLNAVLKKLKAPFFLEVGPRRVLGDFVHDTLDFTPAEKITSTLEGGNGVWVSISKSLGSLYNAGAEIDWTAFHQPYTESVKMITLPTYSWDLKDYWLKWAEPREGQTTAPRVGTLESKGERPISPTLHFVDKKSFSPELRFTFRSSAANPDLKALIKGHRLRTIPVCPGSVFCEMGMEAAKYALEARGEKGTNLAALNPSFKRPFAMPTGESTAEIITTITKLKKDIYSATFAVNNGSTAFDIGQCHFGIVDTLALQSEWDKTSYFIKARMDEIIKAAIYAGGHRFKSNVFYSVFSRTVQYDKAYKAIKEAYVSADFGEAVAEVILQDDPSGPRSSSAYWVDSLVHLAGFVANANPMRDVGSTLMMNGFKESKQTAEFHPGGKYLSYVRVTKSEGEFFCCDVFVFDSADKMVMQCSNLQFHEVDNVGLERALGMVNVAPVTVPKFPTPEKKDPRSSNGNSILETLLGSIATETGTDMAELTDDALLSELGVDSIMAINIASTVNEETGYDLQGSFVLECPSIGDLCRAFCDQDKSSFVSTSTIGTSSPLQEDTDGTDINSSDLESKMPSQARNPIPTDELTVAHKADIKTDDLLIKDDTVFRFEEDDQEQIDLAAVPKAKIVLMQGKPSSGEIPLFLIPDGSGTLATYIYLPRFKSGCPVYAIESPFLRCPAKLSRKIGIPGIAKLMVDAILKTRPQGPYLIGGFSGGATISYEICRQFAAAGRKVQGLLLIDMCCPREMTNDFDAIPEQALALVMRLSLSDKRSFWTSSMAKGTAQQHQRQLIRAVCHYDPPPLAPQDRPARMCIIWAKRGLIERVKADDKVLSMLSDMNLQTEMPPGFMKNPKLGPIAWSFPRKSKDDLGFNGWDTFLGNDIKILVADADHLSLPIPPNVSCPLSLLKI